MHMNKEIKLKIPEIILKDIKQEANEEELRILRDWLSQSDSNRSVYENLKQKDSISKGIKARKSIDSQLAWQKVNEKISREKKSYKSILIVALKYAAVIAIPLLVATILLLQNDYSSDSKVSFSKLEKQINTLQESSLITADGKIVSLSDANADSVLVIDGTNVTKDESEIYYNKASKNDQEIKYNTLITPKSRVFNVILADGSKVWLNASSAIKYPTQFNSQERKVYLTGEAFFEVTKDPEKPFIVSTSEMEIEVLGTSFNVMAYPEDELVEATLVEGEVKVKTLNSELIIEPGTQAQFNRKSNKVEEKFVDAELFTSWKDGKYIYDYENIEVVMRKLSRWYAVEIFYIEDEVRNLHFSGTLYNYNNIEQTLYIIELATNIKFEIIDNAILISKN
jgi:transmembrane sensor